MPEWPPNPLKITLRSPALLSLTFVHSSAHSDRADSAAAEAKKNIRFSGFLFKSISGHN
jgi:hypothetical protein